MMTRALALGFALALCACQPTDASDRFTIALSGDEPVQRMDLDPLSFTAEVDNNLDIDVSFAEGTAAASSTGTATTGTGDAEPTGETAYLRAYLIEYAFAGEGEPDAAPKLAGALGSACEDDADDCGLPISAGQTLSISVRGAVDDQLAWANAHASGDETDVPARVTIDGVLNGASVLFSLDYTATFADYHP